MTATKCPVCDIGVENWQPRYDDRNGNYYDCPNCGRYLITGSALSDIDTLGEKERAALSQGIWRGQRPDAPFFVSSIVLDAVKNESLPSPAEQLDFLVLLHGRHQQTIGKSFTVAPDKVRAKIGAMTSEDVEYIYRAAEQQGLIEKYLTPPAACGGRLTMKGWQHFHVLQRSAIHSKTAFMAMPFGNEIITQMVNNVFRDAVKETGFTLKPVTDEPRAGSIDDRIRVEIRLCRFLIADLTYGNQGAYWEAGYAEGLDKKVIYTCEKSFFDEKKTHFDTNHHQTVVWDAADPVKAAEDLKATIRATLPFEAKMPEE